MNAKSGLAVSVQTEIQTIPTFPVILANICLNALKCLFKITWFAGFLHV